MRQKVRLLYVLVIATPIVYMANVSNSRVQVFLLTSIGLPPQQVVDRKRNEALRTKSWTRAKRLAVSEDRRWPGHAYAAAVDEAQHADQVLTAELAAVPSADATQVLTEWQVSVDRGCAYSSHQTFHPGSVGNYLSLIEVCADGHKKQLFYSRDPQTHALFNRPFPDDGIPHPSETDLCRSGGHSFALLYQNQRDGLFSSLDILQEGKLIPAIQDYISQPKRRAYADSICEKIYAFSVDNGRVAIPYLITGEDVSSLATVLFDPDKQVVLSTRTLDTFNGGGDVDNAVLPTPEGFAYSGNMVYDEDDTCSCPKGCDTCDKNIDFHGHSVRSIKVNTLKLWWDVFYSPDQRAMRKTFDPERMWRSLPEELKQTFENKRTFQEAFRFDSTQQKMKSSFYTTVTLDNGQKRYCTGSTNEVPKDLSTCWPKPTS